jgi:hypothetical protein
MENELFFSDFKIFVKKFNILEYKEENVCVYQYIFDLIDNGVYVVYALYSSIFKFQIKVSFTIFKFR